jgi:tetratricopeptide (TPR) repeat protein
MKYTIHYKSYGSLLALFLIFSYAAHAQGGWNWPEDKATAQEKVVLYTDAKKQKNYKEAVQPLQWLHENAPDLNSSIYVNGADIYEELAMKATDPAEKEEYMNKSLAMYDKRLEYFGSGKEANILNRKASSAMKMMYKDKEKYDQLQQIFEETVEKTNGNLAYYNVVPYMTIAKTQFERGKIDEARVIEIYDEIAGIADKKSAAGGKTADKYKDVGENVDKIFASTITVSCDYIEEKMLPKLQANPDDAEMAKKIIALSLASSCTDRPFFIEAAEATFNAEPNAGLAKTIASRKLANDETDEADEWFKKAIELSSDDEQKGEIYMDMASINLRNGNRSQARTYALKAASLSSEQASKAYKMVGDLYMNSYEQCKGGKNMVEDRAVFIAAYDMYAKAGDRAGMSNAKEQFPSKEEVFTYNKKVGEQVKVNCWVGESVTIQTRD